MSTLTDLVSEINSNLPTNGVGQLQAAIVRQTLIDLCTKILADVGTNTGSIGTINGQVSTINGEITTINGEITSLQSAVSGISTPPDVNTELLDFGNTINLFNPATATASSFLHTDGSVQTGTGGTAISDYMPISALKPIISNHSEIFGGFSANGPVYYDASKVYISGQTNFDGVNPKTAPAGAAFVRVNVLDSISNDYMLLRGSTLPDHYIPWGMTSSKLVIDRSVSSARAMQSTGEVTGIRVGQPGPGPTNLANIHAAGYETGVTYNTTNGNRDTGTIFDTTDYFPVPPGGSITLVGGTNDDFFGIPGHGITYWTASKNFISGVQLPHANGVLSVPAQAYFAKLTIYPTISNDSNQRTIGIVWGDQSSFYDHKFKGFPSVVSMHRPWTNKVWMAAGDSIIADTFAAYPWFRRSAEYHGCKYIKNVGVSGRGLSDMLKDGTGTTFPAGYFSDVDMAFLMGPTNTMGALITLGTISDSPNISGTFYAQMKAWVEFVLTDNPYMRVVLSTCIQRSGYETSGLPYMQAIRDVGAKYGLPVLDFWLTSQFSPKTYSNYSTDGLHPNLAKDWAITLGSNFTAFMSHIFPVDFIGDPLYGGPNYNRPNP